MTTAYDAAFRSQYEQLMAATQQQLHTPLKQPLTEEKQQLSATADNNDKLHTPLPPHLAFTLSSALSSSTASANTPSPLSSTHSLLSQSAPDALTSMPCCSSSLLLAHLHSLASSFASHQQHVTATLVALQSAVSEERRERELDSKRSRRDEVQFRRRLQDRVDECRDDYNDRFNQLTLTAPQHSTPQQPPLTATATAHYDTLSRELDSLRQQFTTLRTDLTALTTHSTQHSTQQQQQQPSQSEVTALQQRVEGLEGLTALHTATIQQQSDHYTAYRTQEVRERDERRREIDEWRRRDREEREESQRMLRVGIEAELRRLTERLDKRDEADKSREAEQTSRVAGATADDKQRQQQQQQQQEQAEQQQQQQQARETADRRRKEDEQRQVAAAERERQKRLHAEAQAEAEFAQLRREQEELDKQAERAKQDKLRQQEAERQRVEMERQKREQERKAEQEKLKAEDEKKRQTEREEAERLQREQEERLLRERAQAEAQRQQTEQQPTATPHTAAASLAVNAGASSATSTPYNLFIRLWNLPLSRSGNNNPIATLFLPATTDTTSTTNTASTAATDGWQYCSQTEWMKDDSHPVFEQALLWDHLASIQHVKISVYDVVDENVRDEDRLGSAVIPTHLLLTAASSQSSAVVRPVTSPVPPADAPVNGLTFRLTHEDPAKQALLEDVILMVECETDTDQPTTPPTTTATATDTDAMLLVRLTTLALPTRADGSLPSPIAAAFLQSADGDMAYVDQTEWLTRVSGVVAFEQAMEVSVTGGEDERVVRVSVYDVDSEEVRDEDRLGHTQLTVAELRRLAAEGGEREVELSHEESVKEGRLRVCGSRVRISVEVLEDEELEFEVEERKAGRRAAPTADGGEDDQEEEEEEEEEEVGLEVDEGQVDEEEEESEEEEKSEKDGDIGQEKSQPKKQEEEKVEDDQSMSDTDDDDVELVVETHNEDAVDDTSSHAAHTVPLAAQTHSSTAPQHTTTNIQATTATNETKPTISDSLHDEKQRAGSSTSGSGSSATEAVVSAVESALEEKAEEEEVEEQYSDFAESSSEDEEEDEEPEVQVDKPADDHKQPTADRKRSLPLMPQLASELALSDDESEPSPSNKQQQQQQTQQTPQPSEQQAVAVKSEQKQQPREEAVVNSSTNESSDDSGDEIEEDIDVDVEFGADDDNHFDF